MLSRYFVCLHGGGFKMTQKCGNTFADTKKEVMTHLKHIFRMTRYLLCLHVAAQHWHAATWPHLEQNTGYNNSMSGLVETFSIKCGRRCCHLIIKLILFGSHDKFWLLILTNKRFPAPAPEKITNKNNFLSFMISVSSCWASIIGIRKMCNLRYFCRRKLIVRHVGMNQRKTD